jgi:hypothetical protein
MMTESIRPVKPRLLAYLASPGLNSPRFRFLNYLPVFERHFDVFQRGGRPDKEALTLAPTDILFIQRRSHGWHGLYGRPGRSTRA